MHIQHLKMLREHTTNYKMIYALNRLKSALNIQPAFMHGIAKFVITHKRMNQLSEYSGQ